MEDILVLNRIRWAQEIRPTDELKVPGAAPKPAEMKMALELIKQLSGPFDLSKYKDTYSDELMKLIKAKAKGKAPKTTLRVVHKAKSTDLLGQLKASLGGKKKAS
jgi:DNA end-binding protein Ku